jgi:hypothetical protein
MVLNLNFNTVSQYIRYKKIVYLEICQKTFVFCSAYSVCKPIREFSSGLISESLASACFTLQRSVRIKVSVRKK